MCLWTHVQAAVHKQPYSLMLINFGEMPGDVTAWYSI